MILDEVLDFGVSQNYFRVSKIKNIDKSCCDLEHEIFDFDATKAKVCNEANQVTRKSCDGLCLKGTIDFIEFKSLNNFFSKDLAYKLRSKSENREATEIIKEKVQDFNFSKKIRDSLWVFDFIVNHKSLQLVNEKLEALYNIEKNYFIVRDDQQPLTNLTLQLNQLGRDTNHTLQHQTFMSICIDEELDKITSIQKPKHIDCKQLHEYLSKKEARE